MVVQAIIVILSAFVLDFGMLTQLCLMALAAFWGGALVILYRRPRRPTQLDLSFLRVGYVPVAVLTAYLATYIWRWRGVL